MTTATVVLIPTWDEAWAGLEAYLKRKDITRAEYMGYETSDGSPVAMWFLLILAAEEMRKAASRLGKVDT